MGIKFNSMYKLERKEDYFIFIKAIVLGLYLEYLPNYKLKIYLLKEFFMKLKLTLKNYNGN
jgi:hypothetical protein